LLITVILPYGFKIGVYWETQAHPTEGVEVVLAGGEKITGTLSRNWNGSFALTTSTGTHEFTDFKMMTMPKSEGDHKNPWRMIFVPLLLLVVSIKLEISVERYLWDENKVSSLQIKCHPNGMKALILLGCSRSYCSNH
jgi:hydrogenase maturation factor HypF (carbamoyltransferase family)